MVGGDERAYNAAMAQVVMGSDRELLGRHLRSVAPGRPRVLRLRLVARGLADPKRGGRSLSTHCEVAAMLAERVGLEQPVVDALAHAYERWDGKGYPDRLEGDAIPLAVRIAGVARDADLATRLNEDPWDWMSERRGRAYDPAVVDAFERVGPDVLSELEGGDEWETALAREPAPVTTVAPDRLDAALTAFADFADLKSPWIRGHSRTVASLAQEAGRHAGLDAAACDGLRRAGLVHDLGRVAVENGIWDKPGPLTTSEWEQVRLHPVLHRANPRPVPFARVPRPAGVVAPRTPRRVRVPPLALCRVPVAERSDPRRGGRLRRPHLGPAASPRIQGRGGRPHTRSRGREQARRGRCLLRARRRRATGGPVAAPVAGRPHRPGGGGATPDRPGPVEPRGRRAPLHLAEDGRAPRREPVREDRRLVARRRRRLRDGAPAPRLTA